MGYCDRSLPPFVCNSPHIEHSLSLLLDFSWPQTTRFAAPLSVKGLLVYRRLEKLYTAISSVIDLSNKFVGWKCFGDGWCLIDAFRLNYFIQSRQVLSNNRWHKFHGSIIKTFGCTDHNRFWWFHLRHPLGLCHGVSHCRTNAMTYSRTLLLLLVEK